MSTLSERLIATTADGFVCSKYLIGTADSRKRWIAGHYEHGCTVSTVPADEVPPSLGDRWTSPVQREATS